MIDIAIVLKRILNIQTLLKSVKEFSVFGSLVSSDLDMQCGL